MKRTNTIVILAFILIAAGVVFLVARKFVAMMDFRMPEMPPTVVTVATPGRQTVARFREYTGTTEAVEEVEIRARVQGYLEKVNFVEGSDVKEGDLLFEIEREPFEARRDQAKASVKSSEADLTRAEQDLSRAEEAVKSNAISQQQVATYRAQRDMAAAAVMANKAALVEAELNLGYTRIRAPISGRISRRLVDPGNLVGAGEQTLLATVVRLRPMYVYFHVSEGVYLESMAGRVIDDGNDFKVQVALEGEGEFSHEGFVNYVDNMVDTGTGTLTLRAELANKDMRILPGMFVRVKVPMGVKKDAMVVQERALGTDIGGKYLLVVNKDNVVEHRPITIGEQAGDMRVVNSGIGPDETYITEGVQFAFPGAKVQTQRAGEQGQSDGGPR